MTQRSYSTSRPRTSTFVYACPTQETLNNIKAYSTRMGIPYPTGFHPNPRLHVTLLKSGEVFHLPIPDSAHYQRPIKIEAKLAVPEQRFDRNGGFSIIRTMVNHKALLNRRSKLHEMVRMAVPATDLHLTLSYFGPLTRLPLEPLGFDLEFDIERLTDIVDVVRPPEFHRAMMQRKFDTRLVRHADSTGTKLCFKINPNKD